MESRTIDYIEQRCHWDLNVVYACVNPFSGTKVWASFDGQHLETKDARGCLLHDPEKLSVSPN